MAMDPAAFAYSAFGGSPLFNPMMFVNLSGTCATTKLLQCRSLGPHQIDISRKFERGPEGAADLYEEDFYARKHVVDQVAEWVSTTQGSTSDGVRHEWVPILYHYEIARSAAKRDRDWGNIVFTDLRTTRFLLVMCFGPPRCNMYDHYYDDLMKYHADRFMSLVTYLYHYGSKPEWVRATYTTFASKDLPDVFMDPKSTVTGTIRDPPIFHVTADNFVPSLLPSELERVDNLIAQSNMDKQPPPGLRQKVLGTKDTRPKPDALLRGTGRTQIQCAFCDKLGDQKMPMCSRCKLVRYCDAQCQKSAWKAHKPVCKVAASNAAKA
ncbi:hypothetical protein BV25DRAFT_1921856 [Artomyces pyxidatus]|uniref:Uncharacterized protein n=1 Tax=Artomyces pyxidatus TaxID=48021 RepID=A0ACB8SHG6_9AGAM|nr:hypothetical protein BV25DRAFT_1921856 [Artomyces pyxidatus]